MVDSCKTLPGKNFRCQKQHQREQHQKRCHSESQRKKEIVKAIEKLVYDWKKETKCEQNYEECCKTKRCIKPVKFGVWQPRPQEFRDRVKSREMIDGKVVMTNNCICGQRNGLQDTCRRKLCRGRPLCLTLPLPLCPPFTGVPKQILEWKDCCCSRN